MIVLEVLIIIYGFKMFQSLICLFNSLENLFNIKFHSQNNAKEPSILFSADRLMRSFDTIYFRPWKYFFTNNRFLSLLVSIFDDNFWQNFQLVGHIVTIYSIVFSYIKQRYIELFLVDEMYCKSVNSSQKESLFDLLVKSRLGNSPKWLFSKLAGIQEVIWHTITFVLVGHDTTTTSITWALYYLAHHPEVQQKLCHEIDSFQTEIVSSGEKMTVFSMKRLKYLECCIKETLRLVPVSPFVGRIVSAPIQINQHTTIPTGTNISVPLKYIFSQEKYFKNAHQYYPERFLPNANTQTETWVNQAAFIPFSAGRVCLGHDYGMLQLKLVLFSIFSKYQIEPMDQFGTCKPCHNVIQRPAEYSLKFCKRFVK